ncbi:hypothetical protein JCM10450v2_004402 [Rhodotorula kratochvilovae]
MGAILTPSIRRVINNIRQVGPKQAWRDLQYIGDFKAGKLIGSDAHGNRFFENKDETLWRHRWVDFASHDFNASQVTPEWHAWLTHVRHLPPTEDPVMIASAQRWQIPHTENLTGTRGGYKSYNTTKPKYAAWEPKVAERQ